MRTGLIQYLNENVISSDVHRDRYLVRRLSWRRVFAVIYRILAFMFLSIQTIRSLAVYRRVRVVLSLVLLVCFRFLSASMF